MAAVPPTIECPVQNLMRSALDACARVGINTPLARAEYVIAKLEAVKEPTFQSAARLIRRMIGSYE